MLNRTKDYYENDKERQRQQAINTENYRMRKKKEIEYRRNCYWSITEEYSQTQKDIIKKKLI